MPSYFDSRHLVNRRYQALFYGLALVGGFIIGGGILAACHAAAWVWWLNILVIFYLAISGKGAIVLSNFWLALLLLLFTFAGKWPTQLQHWLSLNSAQLWALTLLALWMIGLLLIFLLAYASEFCRKGWNQWERLVVLGGLSVFSMEIGSLLFSQGLNR